MDNLTIKKTFTVTPHDTAENVGSGSLPVLATPIMVAWMENTAMAIAAQSLAPADTTVGISMSVQHVKASAVGETITCTARQTAADGRKLTFEITCTNADGDTVGTATHERFIVTAERFMAKLRK